MRKIRTSLGHAIDGWHHALSTERNLRLFLPGFALLLMLMAAMDTYVWEWLALVLSGGIFFIVELLNTAIERLVDGIDASRKLRGESSVHEGLKNAKDVAAAASLVSLLIVGCVFLAIVLRCVITATK